MSLTASLTGWIPETITAANSGVVVDWIPLEARAEQAPFLIRAFRQYRDRHPNAPRRTTDLNSLAKAKCTMPGMEPDLLIFHASHCGSTLLCNMLKACDEVVTLSEPQIINDILFPGGSIRPDRQSAPSELVASLLTGAIWATSQRTSQEKLSIVKLTSWTARFAPLLRQVWPHTPFLMIYRDPIEIVASLVVTPTRWAKWMQQDPEVTKKIFGFAEPACTQTEMVRNYAKGVAGLLDEMAATAGPKLVIPYNAISVSFVLKLLCCFGISPSEAVIMEMARCSTRHSKNGSSFVADSEVKQDSLPDDVRKSIERQCDSAARRLAAQRRTAGKNDSLVFIA